MPAAAMPAGRSPLEPDQPVEPRHAGAGASWETLTTTRWQFTNESDDIRRLCRWALDLVDVPWRRSDRRTISVSTRAGVARLDELIGLKR